MFRILKGLTLLVLCTTAVSAQSSTKKPIEGAWKMTEIVVTGTDASNVANPQPGLIIFARKHYSVMWVPGNQPRSLFKGEDPTDQEKIAATIRTMAENPFSGDVLKLEGQKNRWRCRVGSYRIFFTVDSRSRVVAVSAVVRPTSTTY